MAEVIVAPDVETLIVQYLTGRYAAIPAYATIKAYTKVPATRPALFQRVLRTGGVRRQIVIDNAQITLESWGNDAIAAVNLAQLTRGLMFAIDRVTYAGSTYQFYEPQEFSGPANLPDPDSDQERYTQTFSVGVRGSAL